MLNRAINNPKKWGWLLRDENELKENEISVDEAINIVGGSTHVELFASSLFGKKNKKKLKKMVGNDDISSFYDG